jgi:hypothetical protein
MFKAAPIIIDGRHIFALERSGVNLKPQLHLQQRILHQRPACLRQQSNGLIKRTTKLLIGIARFRGKYRRGIQQLASAWKRLVSSKIGLIFHDWRLPYVR